MNVKQLKRYLENFDGNMEVHIGYDFGDYTHTDCTQEVGEADTEIIEEWHDDKNRVIDKDDVSDYDMEECDDIKQVVVLKASEW